MEQEKEALEKKIQKAEADLEKAPPGSLTYHMVDGVCRYYIQEYHNGKKKLVYLADTPENKLLKEVRLPNRYEQKRNFGGRIVCPDFTIFHPLTGDVYIWEHFGMMDDDDYAKRAYEKIDLYKKNDFFPDDKLILTFEDQEHPLTNRKIQATIEYFFGDWLKMLEKLEK